jgi:hypothetical protein
MTTDGVHITLEGDKVLEAQLKELEQRLNVAQCRGIIRKASTKTIIQGLKNNMTVGTKTGNLKKSFGNVTGRSKQLAVVFAGPRISNDRRMNRRTGDGTVRVTVAGKYKGHLANIIENNKFRLRYPGSGTHQTVRTVGSIRVRGESADRKSKPKIPGFTGGKGAPHNIFEHSGIFPARPFIKRTYDQYTEPYFEQLAVQVDDIISKI